MLKQLLNDESGFIICAELVLVATVCIIGLLVGLCKIQHSVCVELTDIGHAIGCINQGFFFSGFHKRDRGGILHCATFGSFYTDTEDDNDSSCDDIACDAPVREVPRAL